jgi:hypothetical protein
MSLVVGMVYLACKLNMSDSGLLVHRKILDTHTHTQRKKKKEKKNRNRKKGFDVHNDYITRNE